MFKGRVFGEDSIGFWKLVMMKEVPEEVFRKEQLLIGLVQKVLLSVICTS